MTMVQMATVRQEVAMTMAQRWPHGNNEAEGGNRHVEDDEAKGGNDHAGNTEAAESNEGDMSETE